MCRYQLGELADAHPQFEERNVSLATISVDGIEDTRRMADIIGAEYAMLSDEGGGVSRAFGVFDIHGDGVAAPATFIIGADGRVAAGYVGRNVSDRPTASAILAQIDRALR